MKRVTPIMATSPRTLKRAANTYRLLRVRLEDEDFHAFDTPGFSGQKGSVLNYEAVQLLLAISVGLPDYWMTMQARLDAAGARKQFVTVHKESTQAVEAALTEYQAKSPQEQEDEVDRYRELKRALAQSERLTRWLKSDANKDFKPGMEQLQYWSGHVARFSFRMSDE